MAGSPVLCCVAAMAARPKEKAGLARQDPFKGLVVRKRRPPAGRQAGRQRKQGRARGRLWAWRAWGSLALRCAAARHARRHCLLRLCTAGHNRSSSSSSRRRRRRRTPAGHSQVSHSIVMGGSDDITQGVVTGVAGCSRGVGEVQGRRSEQERLAATPHPRRAECAQRQYWHVRGCCTETHRASHSRCPPPPPPPTHTPPPPAHFWCAPAHLP